MTHMPLINAKYSIHNLPQFHVSSNFSNKNYIQTFGIFVYSFKETVIKPMVSLFSEKPVASQSDIDNFEQILNNNYIKNKVDSPYYAKFKGYNICFIALESLGTKLIHHKIDGKEVTPFLNSLIKESLYFKNSLDLTLIGSTADAEFATLTGNFPDYRNNTYLKSMFKQKYLSLPKTLTNFGYSTASFHGFEKGFLEPRKCSPFTGISKMYFKEKYLVKEKVGLGVGDKSFFLQSIPYLNSLPKPFFAYLITLSSHNPYLDIPKGTSEFNSTDGNHDISEISGYVQLINYLDQSLKAFFEMAKQTPLV